LDDAPANVIEGNLVGSDINGTKALSDFSTYGIVLADGTSGVMIGGSSTGARNLISGTGVGVAIESAGNQVLGNYIGTDISGANAIPNDFGVWVSGDAANITIG